MTLNEYQEKARAFRIPTLKCWKSIDRAVDYCALGINEEAGEIAGKVKKTIRDCGENYSPEVLEAIALEAGDVCWYLATLADVIGYTFEDFCKMNLTKLEDRKNRGVLQGNGDNR